MFSKILGLLISTTAFAANLRTTDAQQALNLGAPRNYIRNSGAEKNDAYVTDTNGIVSRNTSNPLKGDASFEIGHSDLGNEYQAEWTSDSALQRGLWGQGCEGSFTYQLNAGGYQAWVADNSNNVVSNVVNLTDTESGSDIPSTKVSMLFPCGTAGGTYKIVIKATGTQSLLSFKADDFYLGKWDGVGSVSQAENCFTATRASTNQTISSTGATAVVYNSVISQGSCATLNKSTGTFTLSKPGYYLIDSGVSFGNTLGDTGLSLRLEDTGATTQAILDRPTSPSAISIYQVSGVAVIKYNAGQQLRVTVESSSDASYSVTASASTRLTVSRIPDGPELVLRGDVTNVMVTASGTPTGSLTAANATIWGTEVRDTTGSYNPTTGVFTAPRPGDYCWDAGVAVAGTEAADNFLTLSPYVNASPLSRFAGSARVWTTAVTSTPVLSAGCTYLNASDTLTFRTNTNITGPSFVSDTSNSLAIFAVSQGLPQPFIPGSVFTGSASVTKLGAASINCTGSSSIGSNPDGMVASLTNVSSGVCTITLSAGYFSSTPICYGNTDESGSSIVVISTLATSATSVTWEGRGLSDAPSASPEGNLLCIGPR